MRDVLIAGLVGWLTLAALRYPWIGIMAWTWVSIMNPHRLAWTLQSIPVAAMVGGATLLSVFWTTDRRNFFITPETAALMAFMLWMCITLPFSFSINDSIGMWNRVMKIDLMVLVSMVVLYSRRHIVIFVWVVAGSLAFYGVKGGLFTLATGGSYRVWGPEGTFIEGNNEMALALVMLIPLLRFLHLNTTHVWIKRGLMLSMPLCAISALGSHSRGALLALGAMGFVLWLRSDRKFVSAAILVGAAALMLPFMPEEWTARMNTINTYQDDASAMGRINAWWMAWNLAWKNFFGGGFEIYNFGVFSLYAPIPDDVHAAHSIYFQVLGEHGFVGLFLFMLIWILCWFKADRIRKAARNVPEARWAADLSAMCQVSLAGYAVGGAFLSLAYYDLPYNVLIMVVLAARWYDNKEWLNEAQTVKADKESPMTPLAGGNA
jgi:probable O-glycosylation ligase (exosortase A-associated)